MKPKILIIILAFLAILLVIFNLLNRLYQSLEVVAVFPADGATEIDLEPFLKIQFNRQPEVLVIRSQPEIDYSLQTKENTTTLVLNQPLKPETQYTLTILVQGKEVFSWSFTTRLMTESEVVEEEIEESLKDYPLISLVPYETENFEIRYEAPLFLIIKIKKGKADLIKEEVLDWIRSNGVDPATHQIEWLTPESP